MKLGLISSGYPPDLDGIGDYTWWMAKTLAEEHDVCVFTRNGATHLPSPGVSVVPFFDLAKPASFASLPRHVEDWSNRGGDYHWLVLQYNPFCWGRRGYCPWVPRTLQRIKGQPNAPRVTVMFHETHVPRWPWKFTVMLIWQKPAFRQICRIAEAAFTSSDMYEGRVRAANPQIKCQSVGVGSNVPICTLSQDEARRSLGIPLDRLVIGVFGFAHVSRRLDWIAHTVQAVRQKRPGTILLYVGSQGKAIHAALNGMDMIDAGYQYPGQVGLYLRAMDTVLAPFSDGISARRTSIMSPMQHGIPVASTITTESDFVFRGDIPASLFLSKARKANDFAAETISWLAARSWKPEVPCKHLAAFYERHFSWKRISGKMVTALAAMTSGNQ